jgi:hypothetical protein
LDKIGPRKLLACDGGGIRGIISIEVLARIESELRKSSGNPKLVLADYFDYVGGTSTGAIIATLIALGYSIDETRDFYLRSGKEMFHKARRWSAAQFEDDKLSQMLRDDRRIRPWVPRSCALLMMVMRNATTDSPWPLSNNRAKYNDTARADCNRCHSGNWCALALRRRLIFRQRSCRLRLHLRRGAVTMFNNQGFNSS